MGNDVSKFMDALLATPGMAVQAKPELKKISLKLILFLNYVIERGLDPTAAANPLLETMSKAEAEELLQLKNEMLDKAGLTAMVEHLRRLVTK